MPSFLDLFTKELENKKDILFDYIDFSKETKKIYEKFYEIWFNLPIIKKSHKKIFAIDSSDGIIETRDSIIIHICRGYALSNSGTFFRDLKVNIFYSPRKATNLQYFRSIFREYIEHLLAMRCLDNSEEDTIVMLDGSIYGRMSHIPMDTGINNFQSFMLNYIDTFYEMLSKSRKKGIPIIGISKDSKSQVLKHVLLSKELRKRLDSENVPENIRNKILEIWYDLQKNTRESINKLNALKRRFSIPTSIEDIFNEALVKRPDVQIISRLASGTGYTKPIVLTIPYPVLDPILGAITKNRIREYINHNFSNSIIEKPEHFYGKAINTLTKIMKYPSIVTFYIVLSEGDIPIRVDVPGWYLGLEKEAVYIFGFEELPMMEKIIELISILYNLYAGKKHYNVLMEEVDNKVKFHRKDINLYEKILSDKFNILIEHTRDVRRVQFP